MHNLELGIIKRTDLEINFINNKAKILINQIN